MGRYDTLKQTINICKREGIQWKKCPVWKNVDMDRIKRDKVYRDEVASYIMFWTGRNDLFPYKGGTTPEHLAAHDGEWGSMQEGKLNEIGDTPAGQWMLGRLAGRQRNREIGQGDRKSPISYKSGKIKNTTVDAYDYADKDGFGGDYDSHEAFGRGYDTENGEWANDYDSNGNYDHSQHLDNERQNAENMGYGYAMKAMINAQQRKNPQTVKLSESQLRNMIKETVNRVIDLRDPDDYIPFDEYEQHEQAAKERMKAKASELQAYANEQLRGTDISLEVKYRETEHLGVKDCCIDIFSVTNGKRKFVQLFTDGDKAENKVKEIVDSIMNTNTNNTVKLSESHLRGMIAECVKKVLSEKYSYQKYGKKSNGLDSDSVHSTIKMMTPQCQNPRKGFDSDSVHKVIKGMMGEDTSWANDPSHDTESRIPSSYIGSSAGDIEQIKHNLENITNHIYSICKGLSNEDYSFGYMDANSKTTDVLRKMWPLVHELGDIWGYRFY